jgi:DNA-binding NtrC family response regulator
VSTTNRDLARDVREGRFRADLYYRLCGLRVALAPLRQRRDDIPILVWHFVNLFAREVRRSITHLDPEMMDIFLRYDWPGNVRQLRNVMRTALIVGSGPSLSLAAAPWMIAELSASAPVAPLAQAAESSVCLRDVEREAIFRAMRITRSHQAKAARLLGITDRTLREKLRRYRSEGTLDGLAGSRSETDKGVRSLTDRAPDPTHPGPANPDIRSADEPALWSGARTNELAVTGG